MPPHSADMSRSGQTMTANSPVFYQQLCSGKQEDLKQPMGLGGKDELV